jgi:hypothetical protein
MRTVSITVVLVALLVLVALGSAGADWTGGGEERRVPSVFVNSAYTVGVIFLVAMAALVIWAFTGSKGAVKVEKPRGVGLVGFAFVVVVLTFWVAMTDPDFLRRGENEAVPRGAGQGAVTGGPEGFATAPAPEFQWWIAAGALLALAAIVLNERRRRARPRPGRVTVELEEALSLALAELDGELDADPRRAVIQAYARMETVLHAHGHGRRKHEAPLEYLARVLGELDVRPQAAHALTELFERAKFSRHEIDAVMRAEAVASLAAVRDDLRAAA